MLTVLAEETDTGARQLVEYWAPHGARLMTVRDLCSRGWCHGGSEGRERAVIDGEIVASSAITGVVTRIATVLPHQLPQIAAPDREYVAAELRAFLTAWLDGLSCPVLNRPSASSLMGPSLSHTRWLVRAARAGLALATSRYSVPHPLEGPAAAVATVIGDRWFGALAPELGAQAVRLARETCVELLTVRFDSARADARFVGADLIVEITPEIAGALLAVIRRRAGRVCA